MVSQSSVVLAACMALFLLSGCAEKGPIQLGLAYQTPAKNAEMLSVPEVVVSPLKDVRGKAPTIIGRRIVPSGQVDDLVVETTVAKTATKALTEALERHGVTVREGPPWDLSAEGMLTGGGAMQISGEIKDFWLESKSVPFRTNLKASVMIKVIAGDIAQKKIIRMLNVSSNIDEDILYSREKLEEALSEAMTGAIDQIFKDEELKKRLL